MAETHDRVVMESGGWNTTDVWPVPVECLLNGMTPTDTHLMFGGGHMIQHQFRQRFQPPLQQLNGPPQHLVSINQNVSLPTHSIIESTVSVDNNGQVEVNGDSGQDTLSQNIPLNGNGLDESEESSDGEDDCPRPQMSLTHGLNDSSLVQVQCGDQVPVVQDNLVHSQLPMNGDTHCHHPKLRNNVIAHNHHLHEPPINPLFFQQQDQFEPPPVVVEAVDDSGNDPNTGFSVYGKLYYEREGRVVLHLKQWLDLPEDQSGSNMPFDPSDPLQGKNLIQGCALCRLSGPNQDCYRNQKQGHRHTFRGVLFTFEECTIVELYPEQTHPIASSHNNGLKPNDSQRKLLHQQIQNGQRLNNIPAYLPPPPLVEQMQHQHQHQHQHLDMNPLQPPTHSSEHSKSAQPDQSWWEHFQSGPELKDNEDSSELSDDEGDGSNSVQDQQEIVTAASNAHEPCFPEESTNYQPVSAESPYIQQEAECEVEHEDSLPQRSPPLESLMLIERHQQVGLEQDENLTTPKNQEDQEDMGFNLVESESEDISTAVAPHNSPPPPLSAPIRFRKCHIGKYACPCCAKLLPLKKILKVHLDAEHATNPFRCVKCMRQFADEKSVTKHICGGVVLSKKAKSKNPEKVVAHNGWNGSTNHLGDTGIVEPSSNKSELLNSRSDKVNTANPRRDKKRRHPVKKSLLHTCPKKVLKPFPCNLCPKSFSVQRRLETHRLSHIHDKSSQCDKCGKRFARKDKLMRHMYVHSEEKMFCCSICSKRFSRRDKLADHLKSHGGPDETHHCPLCNKEFLRPDILKQHVKLHGMRNKHQCSECLRFVTGQDRLQQHMARHEEAKAQGQPLLCPLCTKNFIQRQSLKAHIKKFHPTAHARLLSDLDFPTDQYENEGECEDFTPPPQKTKTKCNDIKSESQSDGKLGCDFCFKRFCKKVPLLHHLAKYHEVQVPETESHVKLNQVPKKVKKTRKLHDTDFSKKESKSTESDNLQPNSDSSTIIPQPPTLTELSFTSAASQIVSPSTSPVLPTDETLGMNNDMGLDTTQTQGLGPETGYQLSQSRTGTHIPITLATVSMNSDSVSSQNGILMGSQSLQHAHALLQHAHPLTQSLPPMAHPQGQLHTHISHVSMPHHVGQAPPMCGTPYVIYPHYYQ